MKVRVLLSLVWAIPLLLISGCAKSDRMAGANGQRVVSLAPNLTEIICAIGAADVLVGRSTACDYPPDVASKIPAIGGFGAPSLEALLALKPTLVVYVDLDDKTLRQKMDAIGLVCAQIQCGTLDDIPTAVQKIGMHLNRKTAAEELAGKLTAGIAEWRQKANASTNCPTVFVEICGDPLMTAGGSSFIAELVRLAGGRNVGDEIKADYAQVSSEWVVSRNPDVVLCLDTPPKGEGRRLVLDRAGWNNISAVRSRRVYDRLSTDLLTRPGPRVLDGIEELQACISNERKAE